jgi:hypothetical protein
MKIVAHLAWIVPVVGGTVLLVVSPLTDSDPAMAVVSSVAGLVAVGTGLAASLIAIIAGFRVRRRQIVVPAVVGLLLSTGVGVAYLTAERERMRLSRPQTMVSSDGRWQLTAPARWQLAAEAKPGASLHLTTSSGDLVLIESRQYDGDLSEVSLHGLADDIFEEVAAQELCRRLTGPGPFMVSGQPAVRQEYQITKDGTELVVIHIVLFEADTLHQIVLSTTEEQLRLRRTVFDDILSSVKLVYSVTIGGEYRGYRGAALPVLRDREIPCVC